MTDERRFPIQGQWSDKTHRRIPESSIPWSVAERAYANYARQYGTQQSLERLAERGGFGRAECAWLLAGAPGRGFSHELLSQDPADVQLPGEAPV